MTIEEFGYTLCARCHGEHLTFTLTRGLCDACLFAVAEEQDPDEEGDNGKDG